MNTTSGNDWARSVFVTAAKVAIGIVIAIIVASAIKLAHALHPPRIVPPGKTRKKYRIDDRRLDLITEDRIRISGRYMPPQNGE